MFIYKNFLHTKSSDNLNSSAFSDRPLVRFFKLLIRKLSSQYIRLLPIKINDLRRIPYFSKNFSIDYVEYIIRNNPKVDYALFPNKDKKEIDYFLKMMTIGAFSGGYDRQDFGIRWNDFESVRKTVGKNLHYNIFRNQYSLYGFNSIVYPDTGIFPDNYHLEIFKKENYDTCLDIGAYIGDSAYIINKMLKPKKIYAFEPDVNNKKILLENISLNNLVNIVMPVNFATGSKVGEAYFDSVNASSGLNTKKTGNKVSITTIDAFVKSQKIKKLDLIKMDIEGAEMDTLIGAKDAIKKHKPDLVIAIYHRGQHFFEIPPMLKKLVPNYKFRFIALSGSSPVIERFLMASINKI